MTDYKIVSLKLYDNQGNEIILSRYNTHNVKYAYYDEELNWVKSTDYNYEPLLNVLWVRIPYTAYNNKFLINIAVNTEEVYTSGVIDVDWTGLPNATPIDLTLVSTIDDNAQGFAPRIIKVDGTNYWFEYSQEYGGLYNTNIPVVNNISVEGGVDIVSNDHSVGIDKKVIDTTVIYDLSVDSVLADSLQMTDTEVLSGQSKDTFYLPKYSTIYIDKDGNQTVKGRSTNTDKWTLNTSTAPTETKGWWYVLRFQNKGVFRISRRVYNSTYDGYLYVDKQGYNYKVYCTSKELANVLKIYTKSMDAYLVVQAPKMIISDITVETSDVCQWMGSLISDYNFNESKLQSVPYFITNVDIASQTDYINITGDTYVQSLDDLNITNFNFEQDLTFRLTDTPEEQLSLRFNATNDNTKVTIRVGDVETTSQQLVVGQSAIFTYYDDGTYGWTYTYIEDFNDLRYSSGVTSGGVEYQHIIRLGDKKVVFDLLDFNNNWTIINNNFEDLQTNISNLWDAIQSINNLLFKHGLKDEDETDPLDYRYVSAVTINNTTHYPINSVVDLGEIEGGGDGFMYNAIIDLDKITDYSQFVDVPFIAKTNALYGSTKDYTFRVLVKGKNAINFVKEPRINFVTQDSGGWEKTLLYDVPMYFYGDFYGLGYINLRCKFDGRQVGTASGGEVISFNAGNYHKVVLQSNNVTSQTINVVSQHTIGEIDGWEASYNSAYIENDNLVLKNYLGSTTSITIPSSVNSVTYNESAHTITNGTINLGKDKVKINGTTYYADSDNLIDCGNITTLATNLRLSVAYASGKDCVKFKLTDGSDVTIYENFRYLRLAKTSGGLTILDTDPSHNIGVYTNNGNDIYLYYRGSVGWSFKVNRGTIEYVDETDTKHVISPSVYEALSVNPIAMPSDVTCIQGATWWHALDIKNKTDLSQAEATTYGVYSGTIDTNKVITIPNPTLQNVLLYRGFTITNSNELSPIELTVKTTGGSIIKRIVVGAGEKKTTFIHRLGYNLNDWELESNPLLQNTNVNAEFGANQLFMITASNGSQFDLRLKGQKVEMECSADGKLYVMNESNNNVDITVLLSDTNTNKALISTLGGLQLFVKKGSVTYTDEYTSNEVVVTNNTVRERVVWAKVEALNTIGSYQTIVGDSGYLPTGSNEYPNAYRYNRSGGNLTSINVYVNPPKCTRQRFTQYHTLYTSSSASSWTAFLFGKDASGNNYQISRQHSYDTAYGKEVTYPTIWDIKLQKWVLCDQ